MKENTMKDDVCHLMCFVICILCSVFCCQTFNTRHFDFIFTKTKFVINMKSTIVTNLGTCQNMKYVMQNVTTVFVRIFTKNELIFHHGLFTVGGAKISVISSLV